MIAFLVMASAVMGPGGGGPPPWEQPAWRDFKAAWDAVRSARDAAAVEAVADRILDLEDALARLLPPEEARRLAGALETRAGWRLAAVDPPRGKPARPDWPAQLREGMTALDREHAALEGLRRRGWRDPWIEAVLAADAAHLAATVRDEAGVVEREGKGREKEKLVREARRLLERVRPGLPDLPEAK